MAQEKEPDAGKTWMQDKLERLQAVYLRYGRAGLNEHPLPDVNLFLQSKVLAFRDAPKGRDLTEDQKGENRQLELEIKDISGYVQSQIALVLPNSLQALRQYSDRMQQGRSSEQREHHNDGQSRSK